MAKVVFKNNNINDIFNGTADLKISGDHKQATYTDGITQGKLVLVGSNLSRDGDSPYLSGGTIHKVLITDENNDFAYKLKGADIDAADLPRNFTTGDLTGLLAAILDGKDKIVGCSMHDYLFGYGGNDRIYGKVGDDDIAGGAGNDRLTGGQGMDTFYFNPSTDGKGHDVITDFDIVGPVVDHLWIETASITSFEGAHNGHDSRLFLSDGSTILLKGVDADDLPGYFASV